MIMQILKQLKPRGARGQRREADALPESTTSASGGGHSPAEGTRIYAIGDIHGRSDLLVRLLSRIDADQSSNPAATTVEVFLGDYIDRGPKSRHVLEMLIERSARRTCVFLKGNHEQMLCDVLRDPAAMPKWLTHGGKETLISYGVAPPRKADPYRLAAELSEAMPDDQRDFLHHLQLTFQSGDYFFVHAGIRPERRLSEQLPEDLLWIREPFLSFGEAMERKIVHGHTPVPSPDIRSNRINLDTGAYITNTLSCIALEGTAARLI